MDVSGWTIEQRMRFPDWCFGNRRILSVSVGNNTAGTFRWKISGTTLPDQICIWSVGIYPRYIDSYSSYIRLAFAATVPTTEAEMNAATPALPDFGELIYTPPRIYLADGGYEVWQIPLRKGMDVTGKKLVVELYCATVKVHLLPYLTFSELPTNMEGWLAHKKV